VTDPSQAECSSEFERIARPESKRIRVPLAASLRSSKVCFQSARSCPLSLQHYLPSSPMPFAISGFNRTKTEMVYSDSRLDHSHHNFKRCTAMAMTTTTTTIIPTTATTINTTSPTTDYHRPRQPLIQQCPCSTYRPGPCTLPRSLPTCSISCCCTGC
jgi:hypothetical protein